MKVFWRAAGAAVLLLAAIIIEVGCGETYRPVASPLPVSLPNPSGPETEVMASCCLSGASINSHNSTNSTVMTTITVSGDANTGNRVLTNTVGNGAVLPPALSVGPPPLEFDSSRSTVFTANTSADTVSELSLNALSGSLSSQVSTITMEPGSAPTSVAFQFFGIGTSQQYIVNSGWNAQTTCSTGGSIAVLAVAAGQVQGTACLGPNANPTLAWAYFDFTKLFVLDSADRIYVVSTSLYKVTNTLQLPSGSNPAKVAQSNDGRYIYVMNAGVGPDYTGSSITIIDGQAEAIVGTVPMASCGSDPNHLCNSRLIDIAQDTNFKDTSASNTQINHIWLLHANGVVSVYDGTVPGTLSWLTSIQTITTAQAAAGVTPTNLALMRDGTFAYVGLATTDRVISIDISKLNHYGGETPGVNTVQPPLTQPQLVIATQPITMGIHRTITTTLTNGTSTANVLTEQTTPVVTQIAVSRGGDSSDLAKVYANTITSTTYYCYGGNFVPVDCSSNNPWALGTTIDASTPAASMPFLVAGCTNLPAQFAMKCPSLYNGAAVATAAEQANLVITNPPPTQTIPGLAANTYITTVLSPTVLTYCDPTTLGNGSYDGQKNCPNMIPVAILGRN